MDRQAEEQFVRALQRRDEAAFSELVQRYQHRVFNLVVRLTGNRQEAEDLAQEVFVSVFRHIDQFRAEASLSTWLLRIAANHCKNRLKYLGRRHVRQTHPLDSVSEDELQVSPTRERQHPPDQLLEGLETERAVQEAIAGLDEEHRLMIVLRDIEGLSYQEIEEVTGLAGGTVRSRLHRARMALRERMPRHD